MIFQKLFKKHSFYKFFNYIWILFLLFIVTGCSTKSTYYPPPVNRHVETTCRIIFICSDDRPLSADEIVSLTVAASSPQQSTLSVDEIVAQTLAASSPQQPTLSVDEIVAQTLAASAPVAVVVTTAPDVAPDTSAPPVVADPNTANGKPQLRANQNANVRSGPGVNYGIIGSLRLNDTVDVVAKNRDESWYLVSYGAQDVYLTGNPQITHFWVSYSVTDPVSPDLMGSVPVAATIPSPPTSTPTATATATTAATAIATATTASGGGGHTPTPHGNSPTHTPTPYPSYIEIYNNSGTYICYILTAASGESYGSNHLHGDELPPGHSAYITYPNAGPYELYAQECEGYNDLYWAEYNIFNDFYWELTPGGN